VEQPSVQENLATLRRRGVLYSSPRLVIWPAGTKEPAVSLSRCESSNCGPDHSGISGALTGARVLVSGRGTREAIDPVRVLSNRSSGKQGTLWPKRPVEWRARTLVTTMERALSLDTVNAIEVVAVESAAELGEAMRTHSRESDCVSWPRPWPTLRSPPP